MKIEELLESPYYQGGPRRDVEAMILGVSKLRDDGGLPAEASLVLSQLVLNLAGSVGKARAFVLLGAFLGAADVPS